jgi:hypothetical protein
VLTVADLRKHVTSALTDPALQKLLDAAYEAENNLLGVNAASAIADRFVASTNMKVGAYTLATGSMPSPGVGRITVTHTTATGADTLGTIDVVGVSASGLAIAESIVPLAGSTAVGLLYFASVTSVTGVGWVISGGNDTITVGCEARGATERHGWTQGPLLMLDRAASGVLSVSETGVVLSPLDYLLRPSGMVLERLTTGPTPRRYWRGPVDVVSTPLVDAANRDRVAIALVQLDLNHEPGSGTERIGDWTDTQAADQTYAVERTEILGSLLLDPVGIR